MRTLSKHKMYWLIGLVLVFTIVAFIKGCKWFRDDESPTGPTRTQKYMLSLMLGENWDLQAKATSVTVTAVGLEDPGGEVQASSTQELIAGGDAVRVNLGLYKPPDKWRITATATLSQGGTATGSTDVDLTQLQRGATVEIQLHVYEKMTGSVKVSASPDPVNAGNSVFVECNINISAPDVLAGYPQATLEEAGGQQIGPSQVSPSGEISGNFGDPHGTGGPTVKQRTFYCTIADGYTELWSFTTVTRRTKGETTAAYSPVTITATEKQLASLTEISEKIRKSGVGVELAYADDALTIHFAQPVSFASLQLGDNANDASLKAFDASNMLVDLDSGGSGLSVFGENIQTLVLAGVQGDIEALQFIPQS